MIEKSRQDRGKGQSEIGSNLGKWWVVLLQFEFIISNLMNSRQINQLFTKENEEFNPIETFGNRQGTTSQARNQGKSRYAGMEKYGSGDGSLRQDGEEAMDSNRQQTRIKLLSSYQQSYLESISHHNFTEADHLSDLRGIQKTNNLSYSESKRSDTKMDLYAATDPNQPVSPSAKYEVGKNAVSQPNYENGEHSFGQKLNLMGKQQLRDFPHKQISRGKEKHRDQESKLRSLSLAIEEEIYNLSVQDRLYDYLISRIDGRGRHPEARDSHQVIEKAIDFMDSGEQFMASLLKLCKSQY